MPLLFNDGANGGRVSFDETLQSLGVAHPRLSLHILIALGFFVFGLGSLETASILPIPLYGCWNGFQSAALSGKEVCSNMIIWQSPKLIEQNEWSCATYAWWQPYKYGGALLLAGRFIISVAAGLSLDIFGRRRSAIVWMGAYFVFAFVRSFRPIVEIFVVCVTMEAICMQATSMALLLIGTEGSKQKECMRSGCLILLGHSLGVGVGAPVIMYLIRDRLFQQLARSIPSLVFILYICLLPESSRWLVSQERVDDALFTLKKTHAVSVSSPRIKDELASLCNETTEHLESMNCEGGSLKRAIKPLFCSKILLLRILIPFSLIAFMIGACAGYRLKQDPLPYHSIIDRLVASGISELLALQMLGLFLTRLPVRRVVASLSVLFSLILLLITLLKKYYYKTCIGELLFSNIGHAICVLSWTWFLVGMIRLCPTHSRGTMFGIVSAFALLGHTLSYNIYRAVIRNIAFGDYVYLAVCIFAGISLLSSLIALCIPPTPKVIPDHVAHLQKPNSESHFDREDSILQENLPLEPRIIGEDTQV